MKLPLPPWEPGYSRQKLKTWFIKQLELSYGLSADDLWQEVQMQNDDAFNAAIMQLGQRHSKRRQVIAAAKAKDLDELVRLGAANDPKLAMLAFRQFTRKPGRQRGDPRPRDLSDVERTAREDALEEVDRMRLIAKWSSVKNVDFRLWRAEV
jgi:hypothetical protein